MSSWTDIEDLKEQVLLLSSRCREQSEAKAVADKRFELLIALLLELDKSIVDLVKQREALT